jgi:hypothetical protein
MTIAKPYLHAAVVANKFHGEKKLYSGIADYSFWYESASQMGLNLVVIEAKREERTGHLGTFKEPVFTNCRCDFLSLLSYSLAVVNIE